MTNTTQVHGHRGYADAVPANTIPAFLLAASIGCPWLELDVVITGDERVLVSHEPWMDHQICRDPEGHPMSEEAGRATNIFDLQLSEVQRFGCVPANHPKGFATPADWYKPTLSQLVRAVNAHAIERNATPPSFNIEIKSEPQFYGTYQPLPARFAELVLQEVIDLGIPDRCIMQSFDPTVLEAVHALAPRMRLALLVDNADGVEANLARLSFTPKYYSPDFVLADMRLVTALRKKDIGLLVWTVNEDADMLRMLELGVDGLITDKPVQAMAFIAERQ